MNTIARLEALGYRFSLEGANIRFRYQGECPPDPQVVNPLLEELRKYKSEALRVLREQEVEHLFEMAWTEIREALPHGFLEHLKRKHPDVQAQIDEAEVRLEETWVRAIAGEFSLEEFHEVLEAWAGLYRQILHEHRPLTIDECRAECDGGMRSCSQQNCYVRMGTRTSPERRRH